MVLVALMICMHFPPFYHENDRFTPASPSFTLRVILSITFSALLEFVPWQRLETTSELLVLTSLCWENRMSTHVSFVYAPHGGKRIKHLSWLEPISWQLFCIVFGTLFLYTQDQSRDVNNESLMLRSPCLELHHPMTMISSWNHEVREWHTFSTPLVMVGAVGLSMTLDNFSNGTLPPRLADGRAWDSSHQRRQWRQRKEHGNRTRKRRHLRATKTEQQLVLQFDIQIYLSFMNWKEWSNGPFSNEMMEVLICNWQPRLCCRDVW